jgi:hypothetical protein
MKTSVPPTVFLYVQSNFIATDLREEIRGWAFAGDEALEYGDFLMGERGDDGEAVGAAIGAGWVVGVRWMGALLFESGGLIKNSAFVAPFLLKKILWLTEN